MLYQNDDKQKDYNLNSNTYAMACPSDVDVPRPNSSNATSELRVAEVCTDYSQ